MPVARKKTIHLFRTASQFEEKRNDDYNEPWVSFTMETSALTYNKTEDEKLPEIPLTFEITSPGNIRWKAYDTAYTPTIQYKKNDGEWTNITSNTGASAPSISVVAGDKVQFKSDNGTCTSGTSRYNSFSGTTCQFKVKGNIMSLIKSTDFSTATTIESQYIFNNLFFMCTGLTEADNLILPATTLTFGCYYKMFDGCKSLITAPKLPATTLANGCYRYMFRDCTSLTTAPELPATTLADYCYQYMFNRCTSLTTAPELPATTLGSNCYEEMFSNCSGLTTAPELPATALTYACYCNMFNNCKSLTTAPELPAITLAEKCYQYMFRDCTNLTTVPAILPATALTKQCYYYMFNRCTSLTTAPELPATTLTNECYRQMFYNCTNLNYIKCLATNISADYCTQNWADGVASSGTFVKNPNMSSWTTGVNGIPTNWTVQDAS